MGFRGVETQSILEGFKSVSILSYPNDEVYENISQCFKTPQKENRQMFFVYQGIIILSITVSE